MSLSSPHPPEGVGMDVAKIHKNWELNVLGGKKMKIKCEILATFRNNWSKASRYYSIFKAIPARDGFLSLICFLKLSTNVLSVDNQQLPR